MRLTILASGRLGFELAQQLADLHSITAVMTDGNSLPIIDWCTKKGIPVFVGNPRGGRAANFLPAASCDVLLSVNYLYIVERDVIDLAGIVAVNIHGSLLPKYRGRTPHVWAIINGEKEAGITAHVLTQELDAGDILGQKTVPITPGMTGAELLDRYRMEYPLIVRETLAAIAGETLERVPQRHEYATYYPKRTPRDGKIDWSWRAERIVDWVRAQAPPYPGAFCYFRGQRLIVSRAVPHPSGYSAEVPNGTVLYTDKEGVVVKTTNYALLLTFSDATQVDKLGAKSQLK